MAAAAHVVIGGAGVYGCWATAIAAALLLLLHLLRLRGRSSLSNSSPSSTRHSSPTAPISRTENLIDDADLAELICTLEKKYKEREKMENVIRRNAENMSYEAWYEKAEDGPPRYFSVTTFQAQCTELLRDFYMDNDYRKKWDNTLVEHKQLQFDDTSGIEIGYIVKKFPFLTPREYILVWRVWEACDKTFYCYVKDCEHPLVQKQKHRVRVPYYRSGWCIREVPGKDACAIIMVHQEDNGMKIEMAKWAFGRGIWSYMCKMNNALQRYSSEQLHPSSSIINTRRLTKKVPQELDIDGLKRGSLSETSQGAVHDGQSVQTKPIDQSPGFLRKKSLKKGLLLLGSLVCLSRGHTNFGAQLAIIFTMNQFLKQRPTTPRH